MDLSRKFLRTNGLNDLAELALILLSSLLLGIWAVKGTIALRNILLGVETLLSLFYIHSFFNRNFKIPFKNWIPLLLLALMILWVTFHYFYLSQFPDQQFHELISTWMRSVLAAIIGAATGLVLLRRVNAINFLWIAILLSFVYMLYQYIPRAIAQNSFFDGGFPNYIYSGKINGVLAGTILLAGLLGTMLDTANRGKGVQTTIVAILTLLGATIILYSYIFIMDTRNGMGLAIILLAIFFCKIFELLAINIFGFLQVSASKAATILFTLFFICSS